MGEEATSWLAQPSTYNKIDKPDAAVPWDMVGSVGKYAKDIARRDVQVKFVRM